MEKKNTDVSLSLNRADNSSDYNPILRAVMANPMFWAVNVDTQAKQRKEQGCTDLWTKFYPKEVFLVLLIRKKMDFSIKKTDIVENYRGLSEYI